MSEIKNGRLGLYGAEHSKCDRMMTLGFKGLMPYSHDLPASCKLSDRDLVACRGRQVCRQCPLEEEADRRTGSNRTQAAVDEVDSKKSCQHGGLGR